MKFLGYKDVSQERYRFHGITKSCLNGCIDKSVEEGKNELLLYGRHDLDEYLDGEGIYYKFGKGYLYSVSHEYIGYALSCYASSNLILVLESNVPHPDIHRRYGGRDDALILSEWRVTGLLVAEKFERDDEGVSRDGRFSFYNLKEILQKKYLSDFRLNVDIECD